MPPVGIAVISTSYAHTHSRTTVASVPASPAPHQSHTPPLALLRGCAPQQEPPASPVPSTLAQWPSSGALAGGGGGGGSGKPPKPVFTPMPPRMPPPPHVKPVVPPGYSPGASGHATPALPFSPATSGHGTPQRSGHATPLSTMSSTMSPVPQGSPSRSAQKHLSIRTPCPPLHPPPGSPAMWLPDSEMFAAMPCAPPSTPLNSSETLNGSVTSSVTASVTSSVRAGKPPGSSGDPNQPLPHHLPRVTPSQPPQQQPRQDHHTSGFMSQDARHQQRDGTLQSETAPIQSLTSHHLPASYLLHEPDAAASAKGTPTAQASRKVTIDDIVGLRSRLASESSLRYVIHTNG